MKQTRFVFNLMLLAVLVLTSVTFAEKEDKDKGDRLPGWYSALAKEGNMTDEQVAKLKELYATRKAAEAKWEETNGAAAKEAYEAYRKAKESGDKAATAEAYKKFSDTKAGRADIEKSFEAGLDQLLNPEQKGVRAGMGLAMGMSMTLKKADLTEEQKAKIKEMAKAEGAKIAALEGGDKKALGQAKQDFKMKVIDEVLTAEQKAALGDDAKAQKPEKKEKAEKPEKKEKKEKKDKEE